MTLKEMINCKYVEQLALLSKCKEGQVAAVLFSKDFNQIYSIGINGGPIKQDDCLCEGKYGCVHAEQNCLAKNSNFTAPKIMICTKQCCQTCASLIVNSNANIQEFWFTDTYKDNKGLNILLKANIKIYRLTSKFKNLITNIDLNSIT